MGTGRSSKRKGAKGERECFELLSALLGRTIKRRLGAARSGGDDTGDLPGWSVEVKRVERLQIPKWWRQACEQAERYQKKPVLIYRQSGQPWRVVLRLMDVYPRDDFEPNELVTVTMEMFAKTVKDRAPRRISPPQSKD